MKTKYLVFSILLGFTHILFAQSTNKNYILVQTLTDSTTHAHLDKIQYYDGLGYPIQTIQRGITPSGKDLVTIQEYDSLGRESNLWLPTPYAANGGYTDPTAIMSKAKSIDVYGDNSPYSSPVYEASPLNRVIEKYGPGASWRSVVGPGHSVNSSFLANNNTNDSLRCAYYYVTSDNKLVKSGNYDNYQLYVTRTMDEDGHIAFEFKDKLEQLVLTRQINNGFNDTYYVYDDLGNKCFVLPPSAADGLTDKTYIGTEDALTKFAYIYRYDSRNRCIYKKLPGADPIYMIYDKADHLIFSQDGEQRNKMPKEWTFSIPDVFNRTIVTGICTDTISIKNIVLNGSFVSGNNGFMNTGYQLSNQINACTRLLTVDYYDNYDYKSLLADTIKSKLEYTALDGYAGKYVNAVPEISTKGMLTGTCVFMLEEPAKEIITAMYYDDKGRLAQSKATNHLGGYEKDYFLYTFTGKVKKHQHIHNVPGKTTITEVNENFYDNGERLTKTTHSLNGSTPVTLAENTYDDIGRLNSKKQHGGVETTNYSYNIRSWLKSITTEKSRFSEALYYNESSNGSIPCYNGNISAMNWKVQNENYQRGYNFHYDDLNRVTTADYQNNDPNPAFSKKSYSINYSYDNMGNIRTLKRNGLTNNSSYNWGAIDDLTLSYNGNQLSSVAEASLKDDEPHYSGAFNFVDSLSKQIEYKYDTNGNLTGDLNKKISKIQYNILNLPSAMQFCYGNTIDYLYDASGVKRKVKYVTTTENLYVELGNTLPISADKVKFTTQTDYCGNVIYENGTLSRIQVDGGYITMSGTTPTYHYYIQDHQGNNRVVFNQSGTIEQTNHYYPFGMTFGEGIDNSDNRYKYNGKELDRMHGLDLFDYGARHYDAAIGRWGAIDPLAEKYYSISPYAYCANNPIRFIDPTGMDWVSRVVDGVTEVYYDREVRSQDDVNKKYGEKGGVTHLTDGSTLTISDADGNIKSQYTFMNDSKENKYGTVTDKNGNTLDNSKIEYGVNYTIFGTSDNSVNAETLHKNYMWTSYTGPDNPQDYNNDDSFQYIPRNISEIPSMLHDKEYEAKKATGVSGALLDTSVKDADMRLAQRNLLISMLPAVPLKDRARAAATYVTFTGITAWKCLIDFIWW